MIKQFLYAIAAIMIIAQYSETHAAAPSRKVVIGHAAMNARVAPLWVAEDHGFQQIRCQRERDFYSAGAGVGCGADSR